MNNNKQIGLFFGSFNPIHVGHLIIANYMINKQLFDELWFVVSPQSPFKTKNMLAPEKDRKIMTELAIETLHLPLRVCDIEFYLQQPSYTVNTLNELKAKYNNYNFSVIMGADNIVGIEKWREYETIINNYKIYVYPRLGFDVKTLCSKYNAVFVDAPIIEISSTFIRQSINNKQNVNAYIPIEVREYIQKNNLYTQLNTTE